VSAFPRIVRFIGTDDCPDSSCPHCGCTGRYIHHFQVQDGRTLAAMSGCLKLFPVSPLAAEEKRLLDKQTKYAKQGWVLNRRDKEALTAISAAIDGNGDERWALSLAKGAKQSNQARFR